MKIATWNVNSLKVRLDQVLHWLEDTNCDVLALQELKINNEAFPLDVFTNHGFYCAYNGQKTYNGVALISKHPIEDIYFDIPQFDDIQKRVITATINSIRIMCVYVVNGESVSSEKYQYKLQWLKYLTLFVESELQKHSKFILLGDFNIAPAAIDVYDPISWDGKVLCSDLERHAWYKLLQLGLNDSFRIVNQQEKQYTWWDYRNFAFKRQLGLRIDHILVNSSLIKNIKNCYIDINPRKHQRPSDHAPVIIEIY